MLFRFGKKQLFYSAAYHANEWITTPVLLKFVEDYARAYANDLSLGEARAERLFEEYQLFVVPMVNPDGVDLVNGMLEVEGYLKQARQIAADYPQIPFPQGWKANINGVDLNLQFPAGWEKAREIKFAQGYTTPAPRDYVGSAPLTEPESIAVYEFTRVHDFLLILAYHTQGETIYWKYADYNHLLCRNNVRSHRIFPGYNRHISSKLSPPVCDTRESVKNHVLS